MNNNNANKISTNFLLLSNFEQQNLMNSMRKDYRKRDLFLHFNYLYNNKSSYVKDNRTTIIQPSYKEAPKPEVIRPNSQQKEVPAISLQNKFQKLKSQHAAQIPNYINPPSIQYNPQQVNNIPINQQVNNPINNQSYQQVNIQKPSQYYQQVNIQKPSQSYQQVNIQKPSQSYQQVNLQKPSQSYQQVNVQKPSQSYQQVNVQKPVNPLYSQVSMSDTNIIYPKYNTYQQSVREIVVETPQQINSLKDFKLDRNVKVQNVVVNGKEHIINQNNFSKFQKIDDTPRRVEDNPKRDRVKIDDIKASLKELVTKKEREDESLEKILEKTFEKINENISEKKEENQLIERDLTQNFSNYIQNFLIQEKLKKLVENKNVAIVGPANYLTNLNQGQKIDGYDIVIRFNNAITSNNYFEENVGKKLDIWIYNFKDISILDKLPKKLPKLIFCPYPRNIVEGYNINKPMPNCPIEFIEQSFYEQLQLAMEFKPNSALLAILILLRQNVKSLFVTGISFLYDGYYDNSKKNKELESGALVVSKGERNNFMTILKKLYNANDKLLLDNTIINLIYPHFISVLNNLFHQKNHQKLFSTLNYVLFAPSFQYKYNSPNITTKIYLHFGNETISDDILEKMNLIVHSIKPRLVENEVYIKNEVCDYDDLEFLLAVKNKGIVYFSNNPWNAIDNMIPKKNRDYILKHHCYVNGNIYGEFLKHVTADFDINEDNKNLNMLYMLFCLIYYGQKMIYVSEVNVKNNGLREIINVMNKLNLIKYIK